MENPSRLSEVVGEKALKVDTLFRHIGLRRNAIRWIKENISSAPPESVVGLPLFQDQADLFARGEFRTLSLQKMKEEDPKRITVLSPIKKE